MSFLKETHLMFSPVRSALIHWGTVYPRISLLVLESFRCCSSLQEPLNIPCTREKSEWLNAKISFPKETWPYFLLLSVVFSSLTPSKLQQCSLRCFCTGLRALRCLRDLRNRAYIECECPMQTVSIWSHSQGQKEFPSHCLRSTHMWGALFFRSFFFLFSHLQLPV